MSHSSRWRPARAGVAGLAASGAYAAAMYLDMAITGYAFDDVQLIEGLIRGRKARLPALGMAIHLANGAALAQVYAAVAPYLPGPPWLRGLLFGYLFLLVAWPAAPLVDRFHPLARRGEAPRLQNRTAFAQNVFRHTMFGLTLGLVYGD